MIEISLHSGWEYCYCPVLPNEPLGPLDPKDWAACAWAPIEVPGCFDNQIPVSRREEGAVVYRLNFDCTYEGMEAELCFKAVNYYCEAYLNGVFLGSHEGGWDAFSFFAAGSLRKKGNLLFVRVIKQGAHFPPWETTVGFLPDITYLYGGIYREVTLRLYPLAGIVSMSVSASLFEKSITAVCRCFSHLQEDTLVGLEITAPDGTSLFAEPFMLEAQSGEQTVSFFVAIENPIPWEPDNPALYTVKAMLREKSGALLGCLQKRTGLRDIRMEGSKILLNGRPLFLRGLLHWGFYPNRIAPNPDRGQLENELKKVKAYGFNMVKHCLYIPTDDALELADEMGMLLWQELPMWLPKTTKACRERYLREYPRIMEQISGHPSVVMLSIGCELGEDVPASFVTSLYEGVKRWAMGALVTDNSGSGECYGSEAASFAQFYDYHFYAELQNFETLCEAFTPHCRKEKPWLFGEFCDFDTFSDKAGIIAREGETPWWLSRNLHINPIARDCHHYSGNGRVIPLVEQEDILEKEPLLRENRKRIGEISRRQGLLHRKFCLEELRKFPEISGYNITVITDSPLSSSGMFDYRMEPKYPVEAFAAFNKDFVLSLGFDLGRSWVNGGDRVACGDRYCCFPGDTMRLHLYLSNASGKAFSGSPLTVRAACEGETVAEGVLPGQPLSPGGVCELGVFAFTAPERRKAAKITVLAKSDDENLKNEWELYLYPKPEENLRRAVRYDPVGLLDDMKGELLNPYDQTPIPAAQEGGPSAVIATILDNRVLDYLERGGAVLFMQRGDGRLPTARVPFWREAIRMAVEHPVSDGLVFDGSLELNAFGIATDTVFIPSGLEGFDEIKPIFIRVDARRYTTGYYLFEARRGKGQMIATTLRLEGGMGKQPLCYSRNRFAKVLVDQALKKLITDK